MKSFYKTTITQTIVVAVDENTNIYDDKNTFITLTIKKLLPTPPSKEYSYAFRSDRESALGGKASDIFPQDDFTTSEIYWNEASDTWDWMTVQIVPLTMILPDQIEDHIHDGWRVSRCFIEGVKATPQQLFAHLNQRTEVN